VGKMLEPKFTRLMFSASHFEPSNRGTGASPKIKKWTRGDWREIQKIAYTFTKFENIFQFRISNSFFLLLQLKSCF